MRIAMVSEHASPLATIGGVDAGGQNVHVAALATTLARRGHPVTVYTRADAPDLAPRVPFAAGVTVEHVPAGPARPISKDELLPHMAEFADGLAVRLAADGADGAPGTDLVHAHFWMSGLVALTAARPLGLPVVQTFHALGAVKRRYQGHKDTSPRERVGVETRIAGAADRVIATCSDEVFQLRRLGAGGHNVSVVPCGVDTAVFRPAGRAIGRSRGPRLLVAGRLVERKGVDDTIRALAGVPSAELLVVGGPPIGELDADAEVRRLRRVARDCGVTDRVHFAGGVAPEAMPMYYRSADLVVCTPWYEPFGIVPLEAMACGVPVVASAVGGLTDTVVHGVTGEHVRARRPDLLAERLRRLLADPWRRQAYGAAGLSRVRGRYGWERIAGETLRAYRSVGRPRPAALAGAGR